jgi:hypothetical protein
VSAPVGGSRRLPGVNAVMFWTGAHSHGPKFFFRGDIFDSLGCLDTLFTADNFEVH